MTEKELIDMIMSNISVEGWENLSIPTQDFFSDKEAFWPFFYRYCANTIEEILPPDQTQSYIKKEQFMELMLLKFELWMPYKNAIRCLQQEAAQNPKLLRTILCTDYRFLKQQLHTYGLVGESLISSFKEKGIFLLSWAILPVWMEDDTPDLAKTAAFLDKALSFGEKIAAYYA